MRLLLREMKAAYRARTGERLTNAMIERATGIDAPAFNALANGNRKQIHVTHLDGLYSYFKSLGFQLEEIWQFEEIALPIPTLRKSEAKDG